MVYARPLLLPPKYVWPIVVTTDMTRGYLSLLTTAKLSFALAAEGNAIIAKETAGDWYMEDNRGWGGQREDQFPSKWQIRQSVASCVA